MNSFLRRLYSLYLSFPPWKKIFLSLLAVVFFLFYGGGAKGFIFSYGKVVVSIARQVFLRMHIPVASYDNVLVLPQAVLMIQQRYLALYWFLGSLFFIAFFSGSLRAVSRYAGFLAVLHFFLNILRMVILGFVSGKDISTLQPATSVVFSGVSMFYLVFLWTWFRGEKDSIQGVMGTFPFPADLMKFILKILFWLVMAVKVIAPLLLLLDFRWLVEGILYLSKNILGWLGYPVETGCYYLKGNKGGIRFARACIGISLMLVFSVFVWLTGKSLKKRVSFIFTGLLVINLINALRIVLLYLSQAWHGMKYAGILHDTYDGVIYGLVFLMWVLWVERFSDHEIVLRYIKKKAVPS